MIDVIASIRVKEGARAEFIEKFKANCPTVLAEEGCIHYYPTVDVETGFPIQERDANIVTIVEQWESLDHLKAHAAAPHMKEFRQISKDLVEGTTLKVLEAA